jgi:uncharacterized protein YhbP (UPF0306 family)
MPGRKKDVKYPLGIYKHKNTNKFIAQFWDVRTKHNKIIGSYNSVEEAINARSEYVEKLLKSGNVVKPINRGLPKGIMIANNKKGVKYKSEICFVSGKRKEKVNTIYLGTYESIDDAYNARKSFLEKLM